MAKKDVKFPRVAVLWKNSKWKHRLHNYVQNYLPGAKSKCVNMAHKTNEFDIPGIGFKIFGWVLCSKEDWNNSVAGR